MQKHFLGIVCLLVLVGVTPALAQQNFTEGTISRVILLHIKPGRTTPFWADVRQNLKPVYEEYKKQGVITNYSFFTKATTENAEDWNVGIVLTYPNFAALDGLTARTDPITLKFFGSADARAAVAIRRTENVTLVSSSLIRQVDPLPMTAAGATPPR